MSKDFRSLFRRLEKNEVEIKRGLNLGKAIFLLFAGNEFGCANASILQRILLRKCLNITSKKRRGYLIACLAVERVVEPPLDFRHVVPPDPDLPAERNSCISVHTSLGESHSEGRIERITLRD